MAEELTETEVMNLRGIAGAVDRMLKNPESRKRLLEAQKIINPNAVIPELDATRPLNDAISGMNKKMDDLANSIAKDKQDRSDMEARARMQSQWEAGRATANRAGYTKEGLEALENFMVEKGIADHEVAMPAFERINPPSAPISASKSGFDLLQQSVSDATEEMKKLIESRGQDRGAVNSLVAKTLSEVRGR